MLDWKLDNELLKEQINLFVDSVKIPSISDKLVWINCKIVNEETTIYTIGYCINIVSLIYSPPQLFFEVDGNTVCMSIQGMEDFVLNDESLLSIMKSVFPTQYKYYVENEIYPPPITAREVLWELTFKEGELMNKKIIRH